ncbi:hypothetical protein HDU98_001573, partial [Podochytrium sp. JEL0797]
MTQRAQLNGTPLGTDSLFVVTRFGGAKGGLQVGAACSGQGSVALRAFGAASVRAAKTSSEAAHVFAFAARETRLDSRAIAKRNAFDVLVAFAAAAPLPHVLAVVSSHFSVALCVPAKDPSDSEWVPRRDLLDDLMRLYKVARKKDTEVLVDTRTANLLESCSLSWSELCIDKKRVLGNRFCFLAIGSKEGTITLWRFHASDPTTPVYQTSIKPHDGWITRSNWSQWVSEGPASVQHCYMLSSYANGCLYAHKVTFDPSTLVLDVHPGVQLFGADNRPASVIKFFANDINLLRCAIAKSTTLHIWTADTPLSSPLALPTTMPVGGLTWSLGGDEVHVYSTDGRCCTVEVAEGEQGSRGVEVAVLEETTQMFYAEMLGEEEEEGEEEGEEGDAAVKAGGVGGKTIRFYGAVSTLNGLADVLLYTVNSSEGLDYRTGKTENSHVAVHWNYAVGNVAVEEQVVERVKRWVRGGGVGVREGVAGGVWDLVARAGEEGGEGLVEGVVKGLEELAASGGGGDGGWVEEDSK